jgi:hypothetical protein
MANEKQRRRRAKEKRHAYDLVEIDSEGNETVLTASALKSEQPEKAKRTSKPASKPSSRRGVPQPPSWQRVAKRAAIFIPIFFVIVMVLGGGKTTIVGAAINSLFLLAMFIPLSYVMDSFVYRTYQKRLAKSGSR